MTHPKGRRVLTEKIYVAACNMSQISIKKNNYLVLYLKVFTIFVIYQTLIILLKRFVKKFPLTNTAHFSSQLLCWVKKFEVHLWLDSNQYQHKHSTYGSILAADPMSEISSPSTGSFDILQRYIKLKKDWLFGYLSYDLKNDLENLDSSNADSLKLPEMYFFQPKKIWIIESNCASAHYTNQEDIENDWLEIQNTQPISETSTSLELKPKFTKQEYLDAAQQLIQHIHRGDIYEVNFCMEWFAEQCKIVPLSVYQQLNKISKTPFAAYFKKREHYLICASPERFLKKTNTRLISQPIKGTAKRDPDDVLDKSYAFQLVNNNKERAENIMITDLVRNDLSRVAKKRTVQVSELCHVYPFEQVHQMITTIEAELDSSFDGLDAIKACFPMGSMTGAPKIKAMKLIENYEQSKRGLYSGSVGYFTPEGDFDFNVVIRSMIYNAKKEYLSIQVGSALTAAANPIDEFQECQLKVKALKEVLRYPALTKA